MGPKVVPDTKMNRPTDRRSQNQLNSTQLLLKGRVKTRSKEYKCCLCHDLAKSCKMFESNELYLIKK
jgi:hypothetical protein